MNFVSVVIIFASSVFSLAADEFDGNLMSALIANLPFQEAALLATSSKSLGESLKAWQPAVRQLHVLRERCSPETGNYLSQGLTKRHVLFHFNAESEQDQACGSELAKLCEMERNYPIFTKPIQISISGRKSSQLPEEVVSVIRKCPAVTISIAGVVTSMEQLNDILQNIKSETKRLLLADVDIQGQGTSYDPLLYPTTLRTIEFSSITVNSIEVAEMLNSLIASNINSLRFFQMILSQHDVNIMKILYSNHIIGRMKKRGVVVHATIPANLQ